MNNEKVKSIILIGILMHLYAVAMAQTNSCPSGPQTDPNQYQNCDCHPSGPFINTAPQPYTGNYQINTWDWTLPHLDATNTLDFEQNSNYQTPPGIESPYYSSELYLQDIAGSANSDFYPADGWELIKRDFGTLNSGASTNGAGSPTPYFILYNKYSGKLRVLADIPVSTTQIININLQFINPSAYPYAPSVSGYKVSGLFAHYGMASSILDQNSAQIGTLYSTPAIYPNYDYAFFYGDFQMAYDPCTCLFESGIEVSFDAVNTYDVNLSGNILGSSIPVTDNTALNQIDPNKDWLSSVGNNGYNVNNGLQIYNSISQLTTDYQNQLNAYNAANDISTGLTAAGAAFTAIGQAVGGGGGDAGIAGGILQGVGTLFNFFGSTVKPTAPIQPTVQYAQTQLTGTINESTLIGASSFTIGNPGCLGSQSLPELCSNSTGPAYPTYNEILGVFALLQTPYVIRYNWSSEVDLTRFVTYYDDGDLDTQYISTTPYFYNYHAYRLNSPSDIQYAINPATNPNMSSTTIQAAWEDYWSDQGYFSNSNVSANGITSNPQEFGPGINLSPVTYYPNSIDYISPFFNLANFQNLYISPPNAFTGTMDGSSNVIDVSNDSLFLKFNILLVSNDIGTNGEPNMAIFTIRYFIPPDHIINQNITAPSYISKDTVSFYLPSLTVPIITSSPNFPSSSLPGFVNIPPVGHDTILAGNVPLGSSLSGFYNIYIVGPLTTTSSTPINIEATNSIIMTGNDGASVGPNINLVIASNDGVPAGSQIPPASTSSITTFCTNGTYKANQALQELHVPNTNQQPQITTNNFAINLYPNPTTAQCTVRFTESVGADVTITISDITGRDIGTIDQAWHNAGTSFVPFSTVSYAPGVYLVHFSDGTNISTQMLTVNGKY